MRVFCPQVRDSWQMTDELPRARLTSMVCRRSHWDAPWFERWNALFAGASQSDEPIVPAHVPFHRKWWEWAAIAQTLDERGMLKPGKQGCGFAVGREPLASAFAQRGVDVLGTDLAAEDETSRSWSATGQHAAARDSLYWADLVDRSTFDARVRFVPQDMRALQPDQLGVHDFIWSSCSFEHLGDLEAGLQFVLRSTELLRPGGVAVHTTEFNVSDEERTIFTGPNVIYRRKDLSALAHRLRLIGCGMEPLDDFAGTDPEDLEYDFPPYYSHGRPGIKILLGGFVTTSCLIIITKARYPDVLAPLRIMESVPIAVPPPQPPKTLLDRLRGTRAWRALRPLRVLVRRLQRSLRRDSRPTEG